MSGCVTVTGPPARIWSNMRGMTLPLLPSTLPNRTVTNRVSPASLAIVCTISSATRLLAPMTLDGFTALSVETNTKRSAP